MNVGQICTKGAVTASASATLSDVAQLMCEHHVGTVVITDRRNDTPVVVGIITDRDVVRAQLQRVADLSRLQAGDHMAPDPLVLSESGAVANALHHLQARHVRRAPVIGPGGELVGVISTDDLLAEVSDELVNLAQLAAQQRSRERP